MELKVVSVDKEAGICDIVNTQTNELVKISLYKLICGMILNDAPVSNAKAFTNAVQISINGDFQTYAVTLPEEVKQMIKEKKRRDKNGTHGMSDAQIKKQVELERTVSEYHMREKERKHQMAMMKPSLAKPGELTDEERRIRRAEYFKNKAKSRVNA